MYLNMKDCDEPLFGEDPDPESQWGLIFDGAVNVMVAELGQSSSLLRGLTSLFLQDYSSIARITLRNMNLASWVLKKLST